MDRDVQVKVLRTTAEIDEIRPAWKSWPGNRDSDIDFYLTVLRSDAETVRPHVIVVYRRGQPEAVLVGRLDRRRMAFRVGYINCAPKADVLYFVYGALRGTSSPSNSTLLVGEICRSLSVGEADVAYMNWLSVDSHLYQVATTMPGRFPRDYFHVSQPHFSATIPRAIDEFYHSLSGTVRRGIMKQTRRLVRNFGNALTIRLFQDQEEIDELLRDVELVARTTYQRGLGVGFRDCAPIRERLRLKALKGWLRSYVLYIGTRPAAFLIGDINDGTFGGDYTGYDPAFRSYSPGVYLIVKIIEDLSIHSGVVTFDFGPGYAEYKRVLSDREWQESAVYLFARSLKGLELSVIKSLTGALDQGIKKVLAQQQVLQAIKRHWRDHSRYRPASQQMHD